jgi:hypothetical protein
MTKECMYSDEKPCEFLERTGQDPGGHDCHICAIFQVSDVLISIWGLMDERMAETSKNLLR